MTPQTKVVWAPQPGSQLSFLQCPLYEILYAGNRGGGKTDCLLMKFAQHVGQGFGSEWRGVIFRHTFPQLQDIIAKSKHWFWQMWTKQEAQYNEGKSFWEWHTGERLYFRQCKTDSDYYNYHGHSYPFIGWEELTTWPDDVLYKRMMSTSRSTNPKMPRYFVSTTNPYGPGMGWVKQRWRLPGGFNAIIDDEVDEITGGFKPPRIAIESSLDENRILLDADPGYKARIAESARNEAEKRAWLYNDWNVAAGSMFHDVWDDRYNVVPPFFIPPTWKVDRAFDWGSSKPFSVGWWAVSNGEDIRMRDGSVISTVRGDLFRVHEWYGWTGKANEGLRMLAADVAKGIVLRERDHEILKRIRRIRPGPADTSIWAVENGMCIADDMAKKVRLDDGSKVRGIRWTKADKSKGSRKVGWEVMRKALKAAHPNPDGTPREEPGLFVFSTCVNFLRTVPSLPRDEDDPDEANTDAEDHIADEARYRVRFMGRGAGSTKSTGGLY